MKSQADRMPCIEAAGWAISSVPTRCPFTGVVIKWRRIEPQPGDHGKRMTLARVDRDPFARAAFTVPAKLG